MHCQLILSYFLHVWIGLRFGANDNVNFLFVTLLLQKRLQLWNLSLHVDCFREMNGLTFSFYFILFYIHFVSLLFNGGRFLTDGCGVFVGLPQTEYPSIHPGLLKVGK